MCLMLIRLPWQPDVCRHASGRQSESDGRGDVLVELVRDPQLDDPSADLRVQQGHIVEGTE